MTKSLSNVDQIVAAISATAQHLGKAVYDLSKAEVMKHSGIDEWQFRKVGGMAAVRKANFPEPLDLAGKRGSAIQRSYVNKLERQVGDQDHLVEAFGARLEEVLAKHPIKAGKIVKTVATRGAKSHGKQREVVAVLSDLHFGLEILESEIPGNAYNWQIAARRMACFAEQIGSFKIEHRADTDRLRLLIIGDLISGVIHLDDSGIDLLTNQFRGSVDILIQFIDYLRQHFKEIVIETTPGNHDRLAHKGPGRQMAQKWDSHSTMIMIAVAAAYRGCKDVTFHMPKTQFVDFEILGNRFLATHMDGFLDIGNPSTALNISGISRQIDKLNASDIVGTGKRFAVIIGGHVHRPVTVSLENGTELVVNSTLSGTDGYASTIGVFSSRACQTIFESTADFPLGDYRRIYLNAASSDLRFDKIIKPWVGNLELE